MRPLMKRNRINVLIVDDDSNQGKALLEALNRAGYTTHWFQSSVEALKASQRQDFQCLIVDCVLPRMSGVDLVEEIKAVAYAQPVVILISGIFKDKSFIKEAIQKTGAAHFLTKPFEVKDLMTALNEAFPAEQVDEDPPLLRMYGAAPLGEADLLQLIRSESTIHSIHLPMLYKRLLATKVSGELALTYGSGDLCAITFANGKIAAVRTPERDNFFGGLAVEHGFATQEEISDGLKNQGNRRIGQTLIEAMVLSPHAIQIILEEQLALRLSLTLRGGVVSAAWTPQTVAKPEHVLAESRFENLLSDWSRSKFDIETVRAQFSPWGAYRMEGHAHADIENIGTLDELLSHDEFVPDEDMLYLYRQLLSGNLTLGGHAGETQSFNLLERRLTQMLEDYKTLSYYQVLSVGEKAHGRELNRAFQDLKAIYDPAKLPPGSPVSLVALATKVFQHIDLAFKTLSDDEARAAYYSAHQKKRTREALESEPIFRAAISELYDNQAKSASARFHSLWQKRLPFPDLKSYCIWAGLKANKHYSELKLDQVPPEERHSAPYHMAKGVYYSSRGRVTKALDSFRTAYQLEPQMRIARTELERLKIMVERSGNRDLLKDVTGAIDSLFGRLRRGA